jgi:hypothetical protein
MKKDELVDVVITSLEAEYLYTGMASVPTRHWRGFRRETVAGLQTQRCRRQLTRVDPRSHGREVQSEG